MRYQILIKHQDGTSSYLTHNDRTSWCLRRAKIHLKDFVTKLVAGYFPHVAYVALVAV